MTTEQHLRSMLAADILTALTDDDRDGVENPGIVQSVIAGAEAEVWTAIERGGWSAPEGFPEFLKRITAILAIETIFLRRREMPSEPWAERAREARVQLDIITQGDGMISGLLRRGGRIDSVPSDRLPLHRHATMKDL